MEKPTEYPALDFDGTERRANYRTVAYRIDILHICEHKDAAAILFEIIYRWQTEYRKSEAMKEIERRKKSNLPPLTKDEVDNMMWVWMSYNDFVRECGGAIGYNTVIRMLDYLVETAQIVECRENHDPRYPDYEYRIRMDVLKEKLKALPATPAFLPKVPKKKEKKGEDSTQMGTPQKRSTQKGRRAQKSTQVGTESTQKGRATTHLGTGVYPFGGTSHNYSHTTHRENTEGTYSTQSETVTSGADAPTLENTEYHPDLSSEQVTAKEIAPAVEQAIEHVDELRRASGALQDAGPSAELSTSSVSCPQPRAKVEEKPVRATRSKKTTEPAIEFTPEGRKVYEAWCSLFKSPPVAADKTIECANALYPRLVPWCQELKVPCKDLLKEIKNWLYTTDPDWYRRKGVALCDIGSKFERWQSVKTEELERASGKTTPRKPPQALPSYAHMSDDEYYATLRRK